MKDEGRHFLYTCWHVVTGYDPYNIQVGLEEPKRLFLRIKLQNSEKRQPGVTVIGGKQTSILSLYDRVELPRKPLWFQDRQHLPHSDLNNINIKVPFWHDAVKLPLSDLDFVDMQVIPDDEKWQDLVQLGDKVLIVGYPYGFSAAGLDQPTPIVLTRHIAADQMKGMRMQVLLDGPGTPGMSGAPVILERADKLWLFGIYTGTVFPDAQLGSNIQGTALGRCCNLSMVFHHVPFIEADSELSESVINYAP